MRRQDGSPRAAPQVGGVSLHEGRLVQGRAERGPFSEEAALGEELGRPHDRRPLQGLA